VWIHKYVWLLQVKAPACLSCCFSCFLDRVAYLVDVCHTLTGDGILIMSHLNVVSSSSAATLVSEAPTIQFVVPIVPSDNQHDVLIAHFGSSSSNGYEVVMHVKHAGNFSSNPCVLSLSSSSGFTLSNTPPGHLLLLAPIGHPSSSPLYLSLGTSGLFEVHSKITAKTIQVFAFVSSRKHASLPLHSFSQELLAQGLAPAPTLMPPSSLAVAHGVIMQASCSTCKAWCCIVSRV
jgi:hypothetical protein